MKLFANVYQGRKVFITGHTGFKGFWLSAWLLSLGADVTGYSLSVPTTPSGFEALGLKKRMRHVTGDVRDRESLTGALNAYKPDIVFHMAAQALVRLSYDDPAFTFESNALGTLNLLEAVRGCPSVQALVLITSDKCYRNDEWVWGYRETDHLGGKDPYSASKACAEIIAHSYFHSFFGAENSGPRAATVRAGNVIGGGDWAMNRIVPDCARAYAAGRPVLIRSPWATRPWQHVLEPLSGYLWLGACLLAESMGHRLSAMPCNRESFNFGPPADVNATVEEVVETLAGYWPGFTHSSERNTQPDKMESTLLKLCCDKALAHLNWRPTLFLEESIAFTAEWYREYYNLRSTTEQPGQNGGQGKEALMHTFTIRQIVRYAEKAAEEGLIWTR